MTCSAFIIPHTNTFQNNLYFDDLSWRGRLAIANSAADYFAIWRERYHSDSRLAFGFKGWTWVGYLKAEKTSDGEVYVEHAKRIADCTAEILYSIEDDTLPYDSKISHVIKLGSTHETEYKPR